MLKKIIHHSLVGRWRWQSFFEKLHRFALNGMHYGQGYDVRNSGESIIVNYLVKLHELRTPPVIFDVGANVGNYALQMLQGFGSAAHLFCFEPSKKAFAVLSRNLSVYANAKAYNFGFGEAEQTVTLFAEMEGSELGSVFHRQLDHFGIAMTYTEEVVIRRLDTFCTEQGISHIRFLKLDVEGNELNVLRGAKQMLEAQAIDFIQFEFGGCNIDSRTYFQDFYYLLNPQYRLYRIVKDGFVSIDDYKETQEVFITTNYLAISRSLSVPTQRVGQ